MSKKGILEKVKIFTKETLDSFSINYSVSHLDDFAYAHTENQLIGWLDLVPPPSINEIHSRYMINKMKKRNTFKNNRGLPNLRNTSAGRLNLLPAAPVRGSRVQRMAGNIETKIAAQKINRSSIQ